MFDTSVTPASYIVSEAFRCSHLVFAATTYNAGVFVTMENLLHDIAAHNLRNRKVALIENGSWAPTSGKVMAELLSGLKGVEIYDQKISLKSALNESQLSEIEALADVLAGELAPKPLASAPAATSADVVEMLKLWALSPPVPTISNRSSPASTFVAWARMAAAQPAISSVVSALALLVESAARKAAFWVAVVSPLMISFMTV
jgi:hypothetical protein